jgi:alkylhydroperoxidase/carboxymuconolactone decarboxylase family protein YurZ
LLLFQPGIAHPISPPRVEKSRLNATATVMPDFLELSPPDAAFEERELIRRLNALTKALNAFGATYKNGQVDLNEVKALRKALHELEKSELFRPPKAK